MNYILKDQYVQFSVQNSYMEFSRSVKRPKLLQVYLDSLRVWKNFWGRRANSEFNSLELQMICGKVWIVSFTQPKLSSLIVQLRD